MPVLLLPFDVRAEDSSEMASQATVVKSMDIKTEVSHDHGHNHFVPSPVDIQVSIRPIAMLVSALLEGYSDQSDGGQPDGNTTVGVVVPDGHHAHEYRLRPNDVRTLSQSELLVWVGEEYEPFLKSATTKMGSAKTLTIALPDGQYHFWLNPVRTMVVIEVLSQNLIEHGMEPSVINRNKQTMQEALTNMDHTIETALKPYKKRRFIAAHNGLESFASQYGLTIVEQVNVGGHMSGGLSASRAAKLNGMIQQGDVACVISDLSGTRNLARQLKITENKVVEMDVLGQGLSLDLAGYTKLMQHVSKQIEKCLAPK